MVKEYTLSFTASEIDEKLGSVGNTATSTAVYIGPNEPTDGTLYWLDTSDSSEAETASYTVTTNLSNVTIDNNSGTVNEGTSFAAALTADTGYTLSSVSVTMGGWILLAQTMRMEISTLHPLQGIL